MTKVSDQSYHGAAERVAETSEHQHPQKTTAEREWNESQIGHVGHAVERARRPTQTVNVFRKKDRERAESLSQAFDARLRDSIKTKSAHSLAEETAGEVGEIVARRARDCGPEEQFQEAVILD